MADRFFDKVYEVTTPDETRALYDRFSDVYDAEVTAQGYATPGRIAAALAAVLPVKDAPVLDFGCGTGLSGAALRAAGFGVIDGLDLSDEMLAHARRLGVYRSLGRIGHDAALGHRPGDYAAIVACGVIGAGAAPLPVLDRLLGGLAPGGFLAFSFNDHTLEDPAYEARVRAIVDAGEARQKVRDTGPHLPGLDLNSVVFVLEKS